MKELPQKYLLPDGRRQSGKPDFSVHLANNGNLPFAAPINSNDRTDIQYSQQSIRRNSYANNLHGYENFYRFTWAQRGSCHGNADTL